MIFSEELTIVYCEECEDCAQFTGMSIPTNLRQAREDGWAISRDKKRAY